MLSLSSLIPHLSHDLWVKAPCHCSRPLALSLLSLSLLLPKNQRHSLSAFGSLSARALSLLSPSHCMHPLAARRVKLLVALFTVPLCKWISTINSLQRFVNTNQNVVGCTCLY
ncbi:hypothetical protein AMTRI_Chr06g170980 [Amborella trichopoda]